MERVFRRRCGSTRSCRHCYGLNLILTLAVVWIIYETAYHNNIPLENVPLTLIVSRMRSGSTFTGEIYRVYPGAFYIYEPLQNISNQVGLGTILYMNGTHKMHTRTELHEVQAQMIRNWMTCQLDNVDYEAVVSSHFRYHNSDLRDHYMCQQSVGGDRMAILKECMPWLRKQCIFATARTMKLVNVDIRTIELVHKYLPQINVVYLVRDPRAVIYSKLNVELIKEIDVERESEKHCGETENDIEEIYSNRNLKNRIYFQYYEHLALHPLEQFEMLYENSKLELKSSIKYHIKKIAYAKGRLNGCKWCPEKGDSLLASINWRLTIPFDLMLKIQNKCRRLCQKLGYVLVKNKQVLKAVSKSLLKHINLISETTGA